MAEVVSRCGLLSEPGSAEAFAAAVERLAGDAVLRQRFGLAARAYAEAHLSMSTDPDALYRAFDQAT